MIDVFDMIENRKQPSKRFDVCIFRDEKWFKIASVYSDSEWFLNWLNENLKSNPPTIGERNEHVVTAEE